MAQHGWPYHYHAVSLFISVEPTDDIGCIAHMLPLYSSHLLHEDVLEHIIAVCSVVLNVFACAINIVKPPPELEYVSELNKHTSAVKRTLFCRIAYAECVDLICACTLMYEMAQCCITIF